MRRISFPLMFATSCFALLVTPSGLAQTNGVVINQQYVQAYGNGSTAFLIATLPASSAGTLDHLHLTASFNSNWLSSSISTIDATFGNRGGFSWVYSAKGSSPTGNEAHLAAYSQSDGSVDLYFVLDNFYDAGTYTILEAQQETVYTSPTDLQNTTPPGTLIFDTQSASYPPMEIATFSRNVGIGTTTPAATLDVNGNLAVRSGGITFPDGSSLSSANGLGSLVPPAGTASVITQANGRIGIGTTAPLSALTLAGTNTINPNSGAQIDYSGEDLSFENLAVEKAIGDIKMVQPTGYAVDAGDMVLSTSFGSLSEKMRITALGNVGIGTTSPASKLEVDGSIKLTNGSGASVTYQDGSVQTVAWNGVLQGGDYAESVDVTGDRAEYEPGDVLVVDPNSEGRFLKSSQAYSTSVMGIYSTRPGVVGRRQKSDRSHMAEEVPMAMIGVVPTKVTAEGGPIKPGDLLVTSSKSGYAMKGTDHSQMMGAIIGKALGHLDAGTGVIEAAVSLQ